jgi:hypothetical protein
MLLLRGRYLALLRGLELTATDNPETLDALRRILSAPEIAELLRAPRRLQLEQGLGAAPVEASPSRPAAA